MVVVVVVVDKNGDDDDDSDGSEDDHNDNDDDIQYIWRLSGMCLSIFGEVVEVQPLFNTVYSLYLFI